MGNKLGSSNYGSGDGGGSYGDYEHGCHGFGMSDVKDKAKKAWGGAKKFAKKHKGAIAAGASLAAMGAGIALAGHGPKSVAERHNRSSVSPGSSMVLHTPGKNRFYASGSNIGKKASLFDQVRASKGKGR